MAGERGRGYPRSQEETEGLRGKIVDARGRLKEVTMGRDLMIKISTACSELNIDGLRGDLVVTRTGGCCAALGLPVAATCSASLPSSPSACAGGP